MREQDAIEAAGGYGPPGGGGYGGPPPGGGGGYGGPPPGGGGGGGGYGGPPPGGGGSGGPPPGGYGGQPAGGFGAAPGYPPPGYGQPATFGAPPPQGGPRVHPLAIVSLVAGILSMLSCCCCGIGIAFGIGAIVCGIIAKGAVSANPNIYSGGGLAISGIVCGVLGMLSSGTMLLPGVNWDDHLRSKYGNY